MIVFHLQALLKTLKIILHQYSKIKIYTNKVNKYIHNYRTNQGNRLKPTFNDGCAVLNRWVFRHDLKMEREVIVQRSGGCAFQILKAEQLKGRVAWQTVEQKEHQKKS